MIKGVESVLKNLFSDQIYSDTKLVLKLTFIKENIFKSKKKKDFTGFNIFWQESQLLTYMLHHCTQKSKVMLPVNVLSKNPSFDLVSGTLESAHLAKSHINKSVYSSPVKMA